jgi:hypothetical protein
MYRIRRLWGNPAHLSRVHRAYDAVALHVKAKAESVHAYVCSAAAGGAVLRNSLGLPRDYFPE